MKHVLTFLSMVLLACTVQAQTITNIFTGTVLNGTTTTPTTSYAVPVAPKDTLKLILIGGDATTDSVRAAVYVQVNQLGRWSQGILIDSLVAKGIVDIRTKATDISSMPLIADSLKARWFYGTTITGEYRSAILARTDWTYRLYVVGAASAPPLSGNAPAGGGPVKIYYLKW